jgi:hypothetical protein
MFTHSKCVHIHMHVWYMFVRSRTHISSASFSTSCIKEISHCLRVCKYVITSFRWHKLVPLHLFHVNGGIRTCIHSRSSTDSVTVTVSMTQKSNKLWFLHTFWSPRVWKLICIAEIILSSTLNLLPVRQTKRPQALAVASYINTHVHMLTHVHIHTHTHAHRAKIMSSSYIQEVSYDKQLLIHIQRQAMTNR